MAGSCVGYINGPWRRNRPGHWYRKGDAGSFDCVRLSPHFAQDDRLNFLRTMLASHCNAWLAAASERVPML